jgi:hypothetical protein
VSLFLTDNCSCTDQDTVCLSRHRNTQVFESRTSETFKFLSKVGIILNCSIVLMRDELFVQQLKILTQSLWSFLSPSRQIMNSRPTLK